nr:YetF domain-containing protein [Arthrobacter sp. zg-Y919]
MLRVEGYLRRTRRGAYLTSRPILLMAGNEVLEEGLRKARILEDELYFKLRQSGIRNLSEVAIAVLEPTGDVSVLRRGQLIDPVLLRRVTNQSRIPRDLVLPGQGPGRAGEAD